MRVLYAVQELLIALSNPFRKSHIANICGHLTRQKGLINDGRNTISMRMPLAKNGHPEYCLDCIGKMTIRCAWCGEPIIIGSPITLYTPKQSFVVPDYAVRYGEEGALVGCLRWACAVSGADLCGYWMPPGEVERVLSPIELCLQSGQAVVVGDTHNYPATASLHSID